MYNWFYLDRRSFVRLLQDELGENFGLYLMSYGFDTAVSFLIGETTDEILFNIQQTISRFRCQKEICSINCILCSLTLPRYAKLNWFIQRLLAMNPHSSAFVRNPALHLSTTKLMKTQFERKDSSIFGLTTTIVIILLVVFVYLLFCLLN